MSAKTMNCNAANRYQADIRIPSASGGLAPPSAAGLLAGITVRFSATQNGTAINPDVDNLPTTETSAKIGRLYVELSKALHQSRLLPLGAGASYWAIWSLPNRFDMENIRFVVADGTTQ